MTSLSLVDEETYQHLWSYRKLQQSQLQLCTYSGEPWELLEIVLIVAQHGGSESHGPLAVMKGNGPSFLGLA